MNKYIVRYYDISPVDPQARLTIKRETVLADSEQLAAYLMVNSGKEVIDVEPVETIANLVHSAYGEPLEIDPAQRDADLLNAEIEKNGWYEVTDLHLPPHGVWRMDAKTIYKRETDGLWHLAGDEIALTDIQIDAMFEKWLNPQRSDIGNYTRHDAYWNGDTQPY